MPRTAQNKCSLSTHERVIAGSGIRGKIPQLWLVQESFWIRAVKNLLKMHVFLLNLDDEQATRSRGKRGAFVIWGNMTPNGLQITELTIIGSSGIDSKLTLPPCYLGKMCLKKTEISPIRSLPSHRLSTFRRERVIKDRISTIRAQVFSTP